MSPAVNSHRPRRWRLPRRITGSGYRLRFRLLTRVSWTVLLMFTAVFFVPAVANSAFDFWWRALSTFAVLCSLGGLRVLWGAAVVVGPRGLRVYTPSWPLRRNLGWHRILATDIIPGFWFLEIEMNSGERIELPSVEHLDDLYEQIEDYRTRLDTV
jgi:hypothetical protein